MLSEHASRNLDIRYLRYAVAFAEAKGLTLAAKKLASHDGPDRTD